MGAWRCVAGATHLHAAATAGTLMPRSHKVKWTVTAVDQVAHSWSRTSPPCCRSRVVRRRRPRWRAPRHQPLVAVGSAAVCRTFAIPWPAGRKRGGSVRSQAVARVGRRPSARREGGDKRTRTVVAGVLRVVEKSRTAVAVHAPIAAWYASRRTGAGGGYRSRSVSSRAAMCRNESRSIACQAKICVTTGPPAGSIASRCLVSSSSHLA
jgi:hypothetical protein